jgi:signal transduction histidine kinase
MSVTLAVVASFVLATTITWLRASSIDADVDLIVGNAMPSILLLADARSQLRRLDAAVMSYRAGPDAASRRDGIAGAQHEVEARVTSYLSEPFFPHERDLFAPAGATLEVVERDVGKTLDLTDRGSPEAEASRTRTHEEIYAADDALATIIRFNAEQGARLGLAVARARSSAGKTAFVLDAACVALALLAAALAVSSFRSELRKLESARDSASRRAASTERKNQELEQFAGRVAHDVLSPLTGVRLSLEVAKARMSNDAKAEATLERGLSSLTRARRIVDGLLEFARAGAEPSEGATADVSEVIKDVVDGVSADAASSGVALLATASEPCQAACSPGVLTSMLANLVRNAVKHMGEAKVRAVTVRARSTADVVRVEVEDTGPGIPPELESVVFEPFARGATRAPGIGLGLATVKRLATSHGGRAGCRSQPGIGSTFWFELPRAAVSPRATASAARADSR